MEGPILMPGSFTPDYDFRTSRSIRDSPFFVPSKNLPKPYSYSQTRRSTPRSLKESSHNSRKRPRLDATEQAIPSPEPDYYHCDVPRRVKSSCFEAPSPAPLVNTDYILAGNLDISTATKEFQQDQEEDLDLEQDYRPNRYTQNAMQKQSFDGYFPQTPAYNQTGGNWQKRRLSQSDGWSKTVWALTGGLAGRVINFCWTSAFNGFHAGGGRGYAMDIGTPRIAVSGSWADINENEDVFNSQYQLQPSIASTPLPGGFPDEDNVSLAESPEFSRSMQSLRSNETPTQHDYIRDQNRNQSALRNNWVMVNSKGTTSSRESSPVRKRSRPSVASLHAHQHYQPVSTYHNARPRLVHSSERHSSQTNGGASYASPRSTGASPVSTATSTAYATSKIKHHSRSQSTDTRDRQPRPKHFRHSSSSSLSVSHRVSESNVNVRPSLKPESPLTANASPEVIKFEKRMRRTNQKQDDSMRRMNEQMQSLMREAQDALAAKIEVVEDDVDIYMDSDRDPR